MPGFTRLMQASPVTCVVANPVLVAGRPVAVITVYTHDPRSSPTWTHRCSSASAVGWARCCRRRSACARLEEQTRQLQEALTSRAVSDQGIGILMAHGRYDADQAFQRLESASRNRNVKLREVARM